MPSADQILAGLRQIANTWQPLAIFWHVYGAVFAGALLAGRGPSRRIGGMLLVLPVLSVSVVAWLSSNPFNGTMFAFIAVLLTLVSRRLPRETVHAGPPWTRIAGILMVIFGLVYPHFLETPTFAAYLYAAPTGLIPCPTLSLLIGLCLLMDGVCSMALPLTLGAAGMFYGATGVLQLGVSLDWVLLVGAVVIVFLATVHGKGLAGDRSPAGSQPMTGWGVGPRLAVMVLACYVLAVTVQLSNPDLLSMSTTPHGLFRVAGSVLIVLGLLLWGSGARVIDRAFREGRLLTTGAYALVRNPMYSGFIVLVSPGIALWFRSWALLAVSVAAYGIAKILIKREEHYLDEKFGQAFLDYRSRVNALIPLIKFRT